MLSQSRALASLLLFSSAGALYAQEDGGKLNLTVRETAGIRRFGFPVTATLKLNRAVTAADRFRLLSSGKPILAQFRAPVGGDGKTVVLDFTASPGPLQTMSYQIEYGPQVAAGVELSGGMEIEKIEKGVAVRAGGMRYAASADLRGLLRQVIAGKKEYLRDDSAGLRIHTRSGEHFLAGTAVKLSIARQGPLATALRYDVGEAVKGTKLTSVVELTFPLAKSWVEVRWTIDDPQGEAVAVSASLHLNVQPKPLLVDFGAGSTVYTTLADGQAALMRAGAQGKPAWETFQGPAKALRPFVVALPGDKACRAEGWAHVMDKQRCTAVAVDEFALGNVDEISTDAGGQLRLLRTFAKPGKGRRKFHFWLHFVDMPVQVGALTSSQAMMQPLAVELK